MTTSPFNVHGTAIVLGTRGFLLVGPSGAGKSTLALALMTQARLRGLYAALISDDQVFVSEAGGKVIARGPDSIRGLLEIRCAGIVKVDTISSAILHYALCPTKVEEAVRLPVAGEIHRLNDRINLPMLHVPYGAGQDSFAILGCLLPENSAFGE